MKQTFYLNNLRFIITLEIVKKKIDTYIQNCRGIRTIQLHKSFGSVVSTYALLNTLDPDFLVSEIGTLNVA